LILQVTVLGAVRAVSISCCQSEEEILVVAGLFFEDDVIADGTPVQARVALKMASKAIVRNGLSRFMVAVIPPGRIYILPGERLPYQGLFVAVQIDVATVTT
jgi:hypothetical protein